MIGMSECMLRLRTIINFAAQCDKPLMISGETGSGKQLVALEIFKQSARAMRGFRNFNCVGLHKNRLLEELFGFDVEFGPGHTRHIPGCIEQVAGGVLVLNDLQDVPVTFYSSLVDLATQSGDAAKHVPTHSNGIPRLFLTCSHPGASTVLAREMGAMTIIVPPLRERGADIELLARVFLNQHRRDGLRTPSGFSAAALAAMLAYRWPGNVRELRNTVQAAIVNSNGSLIMEGDLPFVRREEAARMQSFARDATLLIARALRAPHEHACEAPETVSNPSLAECRSAREWQSAPSNRRTMRASKRRDCTVKFVPGSPAGSLARRDVPAGGTCLLLRAEESPRSAWCELLRALSVRDREIDGVPDGI